MSNSRKHDLAKLGKVIDYRPVAEQPESLVVSPSQAHWIGEETAHDPCRIGLLPDVPAKTFEPMLQETQAGGTKDMQRDTHVPVHFVDGRTAYAEIGARRVEWHTGDFVYTPVWVWHRHYSAGSQAACMRLNATSRFTEALGVSRRESAGLITCAGFSGKSG